MIPGSPIAYWLSDKAVSAFTFGYAIGKSVPIKSGMSTTNNAKYLRFWFEVSALNFESEAISLEGAKVSPCKWFPFKKGGDFRRWAGNSEYVLNWENDGQEIKEAVVNNPSDPDTTHWSRRIFGVEYFFKKGITWTKVSSGKFSTRYHDKGFIFSDASNGCFPVSNISYYLGRVDTNRAMR